LEQKWGDTFSDLSISISLLVTNHCRAAIRQDAGVMGGVPVPDLKDSARTPFKVGCMIDKLVPGEPGALNLLNQPGLLAEASI
jgi:hypothetical protein